MAARSWKFPAAAWVLLAAGCSDPIALSEPATGPAAAEGEPGGLVYALPMTLVEVAGSRDAKGVVTYAVTPHLVLDPDARFRLRYQPSAWRDDGLSVTVDTNGLLTTYSVTKPSTALAVAALPADALKAFFGAIGELLTIRVTNQTAAADLAQQQARLLLQQQAIIEAQRGLDAARAGESAVAGPGRAPP